MNVEIKTDWKPCPRCNFLGLPFPDPEYVLGAEGFVMKEPCYRCSGTGWVK